MESRAHRRPPAIRLRELRGRRGWTRSELAERAGVSKEAIYTHERGRKHPRRDTLRLLAQALGVAPAELLGTVPSAAA